MVLRRVALTGASGMLGTHVLALLAREGIGCLCLCRTRPSPLPAGCVWSPWDLARPFNPETLDALCAPAPDALIHLGAMTCALPGVPPDEAFGEANVRASADFARWARERGVPMAYVSGAVVYADPWRERIVEDAPLLAAPGFGGAYGWSKLQGELAVRAEASRGLSVLVLRPSSIYGLKIAEKKVVSQFLQQAMAGQTLFVAPPARDRVDFVHAADVAWALVNGLRTRARGVFNVGGELITMEALARVCVAIAGNGHVRLEDNDDTPGRTRFGLDTAAAAAAFGYRMRIGLNEGLVRMASNRCL